ncbi:hypothetical protein R1sor_018768 [Riccia sorocarpa]|uniref:Non-specific serine/threonine protein kinase n=1 Tax=Riccia sorocarpa TaxID=122646 RepID=A0ABD3IB61_9MARC
MILDLLRTGASRQKGNRKAGGFTKINPAYGLNSHLNPHSLLELFVAAVVWLLLFQLGEATFYPLPKTWKVVNNESLEVMVKSGQSIRVVLTENEYYSFALAFFNINMYSAGTRPSSDNNNNPAPPEDLYVLGIITMPFVDSSVWNVVWCANWNQPVRQNASVGLKGDGNLALWDEQGNEVWSTDVITGGGGGGEGVGLQVTGLVMEKSGNLQLVDSANKIRWQSFDFPTDTILPDQWLTVGSELKSRPSSTQAHLGAPSYTLRVENAGLALYAVTNNNSSINQRLFETYFITSLSQQEDLEGVLATCFHPAIVGLDYNQGLVLEFDQDSQNPWNLVNSTLCGSTGGKSRTPKLVLSNSMASSPHQFVRLDGDGNLQLYEYSSNDRTFKVATSVINSPCDLPSSCSNYGICEVNTQGGGGPLCSCGSGNSDPVASNSFVPLIPDVPSLGCKPSWAPSNPTFTPCLDGGNSTLSISSSSIYNQDEDLIRVEGVDYFSNQFVPPNFTTTDVQECGRLCTSSCSCSASFYYNDTGACYLVESVHTLRRSTFPGRSAQLKISAAQRGVVDGGGDGEEGGPRNGDGQSPSPSPADGFVGPNPPAYPTPPWLQNPRGGKMSLSKSNELAIGLSVGLGGLFLFLLFFVYTLYKIIGRRKNITQVRRLPEEELDYSDDIHGYGGDGQGGGGDSLPGLPPRYSLKELQIATTGFQTKLGTGPGGFGTVYEGVLTDGSKVAVKRLEGIRQNSKEFRSEVATLGSIHHRNLIRVQGFCSEGGHRLLVYEFMAKGSLDKWLFAPKDAANATDAFCLDWNTRFKIALGTARGLAHLHNDCSTRIIHMDIKPQNVLLDAEFFPKVSDFGLSKLMDHEDSGILTSMRGTPGYLAPELLLRSQVSDKIDIYSYGIVLIELLTGRKSIDMFMEFDSEYFPSWAMNMARDGRLRDAVDKRMGDLVPEVQLQRVINITYWCVHRDFRRRPSMKEVLQMLENLIPVPPIPEAELADLSSFKLPRRLSFNKETQPPMRLQRAYSDQGPYASTRSRFVSKEELKMCGPM